MINKQDIHIQYLPVTKQDRSWGTIVTSVGFHSIKPSEHYPPQGHPMRYIFSTKRGRILDEYQLIYITQGNGFFKSLSQKKIEIKTGNMQLLFPGEWHTYYPNPSTGWNEYNSNFFLALSWALRGSGILSKKTSKAQTFCFIPHFFKIDG